MENLQPTGPVVNGQQQTTTAGSSDMGQTPNIATQGVKSGSDGSSGTTPQTETISWRGLEGVPKYWKDKTYKELVSEGARKEYARLVEEGLIVTDDQKARLTQAEQVIGAFGDVLKDKDGKPLDKEGILSMMQEKSKQYADPIVKKNQEIMAELERERKERLSLVDRVREDKKRDHLMKTVLANPKTNPSAVEDILQSLLSSKAFGYETSKENPLEIDFMVYNEQTGQPLTKYDSANNITDLVTYSELYDKWIDAKPHFQKPTGKTGMGGTYNGSAPGQDASMTAKAISDTRPKTGLQTQTKAVIPGHAR